MPKGERRRRRQEEQENAAPSSGAEPSLDSDRTGEEDGFAESPFARSGAPEPHDAGPEPESAQSSNPRRVALAEVLSKPVFPNVPPERAIPPRTAGDLFS